MFGFGGKRSAEDPSDREVSRRAGRILCGFANLNYTPNTARYLAEVLRYDRLHEVNPETRLGLEAVKAAYGALLDDLLSDILD